MCLRSVLWPARVLSLVALHSGPADPQASSGPRIQAPQDSLLTTGHHLLGPQGALLATG